MKTYTKPEIEIKTLTNADIITASGGINTAKFTNINTAADAKGYNVVNNF